MAIPDFQSTMHPLLTEVKDGQVYQFRDVIERVKGCFQLTDQELQQKLSSGKQTVIKNRISWARTYLTKLVCCNLRGGGLPRLLSVVLMLWLKPNSQFELNTSCNFPNL